MALLVIFSVSEPPLLCSDSLSLSLSLSLSVETGEKVRKFKGLRRKYKSFWDLLEFARGLNSMAFYHKVNWSSIQSSYQEVLCVFFFFLCALVSKNSLLFTSFFQKPFGVLDFVYWWFFSSGHLRKWSENEVGDWFLGIEIHYVLNTT